MPAKPDAVCIARMECPNPECSETVAMFQNSRDYLYTRCPKCKADQRNGAPAQVYFWTHAVLLPEVDPASIKRPRNLPDHLGPIGQPAPEKPAQKPTPVPAEPAETKATPVTEPEPAKEPEPAPETTDETDKPTEKKGGGGLVGGILLAVGIVGIALTGSTFGGGNP